MSDRAALTNEDIVELSALLDQALGLQPSERLLWLGNLPPMHARHQARLAEMLLTGNADVENSRRRLTAIFDGLSRPPAVRAPDRMGPYTLLRELGRGGMASVWLARHDAACASEMVAIKFPHASWQRPESSGRMARELAILSSLSHPKINRLLDAGVDTLGQPYLVLDYVNGEPIDVHCRRHSLDLRERLLLFAQAADPVAYAHRHNVIHRDLKPPNILVTAEGDVRLLDFGIAKLLEDGLSVETELTHQVGRPLTYEYASPEQLRGEPVGIGSDVYALGVVLYELLCGCRPHQLEGRMPQGFVATMMRAVPRLPSETVSDQAMRDLLRGDLDSVVMKALRKPVGERYPSVPALLDDIQRFLCGRRVGAAGEWAALSDMGHLSEPVLREIAARGVVKHFGPETVLVRAGDADDTLFVLLRGHVRIFATNGDGAEVVLGALDAGSCFGELALDGGRRDATVVTTEPTTCSLLSGSLLRDVLAAQPEFAIHFIQVLTRRVRSLSARLKESR